MMLLRSILLLFLICYITASSETSKIKLKAKEYESRGRLLQKMYNQQNVNNLRATLLLSYETLQHEWKNFKETYNKNYKSDKEDLKAMKVFTENRLYIAKHNDLYEKGLVTYTVKINKFGDMTKDKFNAYYGSNIVYNSNEEDNYNEIIRYTPESLPISVANIPNEVDWRNLGAVSKVKNQGKDCSSSWAFSAAGALEGHFFKHNHFLIELSKQNLIDCSKENQGCGGGRPKRAFAYIQNNRGIDAEKSYPYRGRRGIARCTYNATYAIPSAETYYQMPVNEDYLQQNVATFGPVSVIIDTMSDEMFRFYEKGIFYSKTCSSEVQNLNQAVLVVGYGSDKNGDYWLVKNSWGKDWGEEGYIRMARNRDNNCGIATEAILPFSA